MTANTTEQEAATSSKCRRRLRLSAAFLSITASAIIVIQIFVLYIDDCVGCRSYLPGILGGLSLVLLYIGLVFLSTIVCRKRRENAESSSQSATPQVVISLVPAEDLEKSPAPVLPYNHIPDRPPFAKASSIDLPDYFSVVQNIDEVYSCVNAGFCGTEDFPEGPPPCYEQALEMISVAAASEVDNHSSTQGDTEDTRL